MASGTSHAASCDTSEAGGIGDQPDDGVAVAAATITAGESGILPASPTRQGGVRAEDIAIDETDMTWSGSVHFM